MEDLSKFGVSRDVIETKGTYAFFRQSLQKLNLFKYNVLQAFWGARKTKKRGAPNMKVSLKMCMKTKDIKNAGKSL